MKLYIVVLCLFIGLPVLNACTGLNQELEHQPQSQEQASLSPSNNSEEVHNEKITQEKLVESLEQKAIFLYQDFAHKYQVHQLALKADDKVLTQTLLSIVSNSIRLDWRHDLLIDALTLKNPQMAGQFVDSEFSGSYKSRLMNGVIYRWSQNEPQNAYQFLLEHPIKIRNGVVELFIQLSKTETPAKLQSLFTELHESNANGRSNSYRALEGIIIGLNNQPQFLEFYQYFIADDKTTKNARSNLQRYWLKHNFDQFRAMVDSNQMKLEYYYISSLFVRGEIRGTNQFNVIDRANWLLNNDRKGRKKFNAGRLANGIATNVHIPNRGLIAINWLKGLSDIDTAQSQGDAIIRVFRANRDSSNAKKLIDKLSNDEVKSDVCRRIHDSLVRYEPEDAASFLQWAKNENYLLPVKSNQG